MKAIIRHIVRVAGESGLPPSAISAFQKRSVRDGSTDMPKKSTHRSGQMRCLQSSEKPFHVGYAVARSNKVQHTFKPSQYTVSYKITRYIRLTAVSDVRLTSGIIPTRDDGK